MLLVLAIIEGWCYNILKIKRDEKGVDESPLFVFMYKYKKECSMAKREIIEAKTEKLVLPIIEENDFELVDVEYVKEAGNNYLRIYIDKEGGITINDCEVVSRQLGDLLDEEDYISSAYILEVSSPGLGRPLKKEKDFARNIQKEVDVKLYKQINKQKEYMGILVDYDKDKIVLELDKDETIEIPRDIIALIRLAFDF